MDLTPKHVCNFYCDESSHYLIGYTSEEVDDLEGFEAYLKRIYSYARKPIPYDLKKVEEWDMEQALQEMNGPNRITGGPNIGDFIPKAAYSFRLRRPMRETGKKEF